MSGPASKADNPRPTSPSLERFARQAIPFDRDGAPSSWTRPSNASMFAGRDAQEVFAAYINDPLEQRTCHVVTALLVRCQMHIPPFVSADLPAASANAKKTQSRR